jgi:hypothetical protein
MASNLFLMLLLLDCPAGAILIALVIFGMMTYASGKYPVGSIGAVWENLQVGVIASYATRYNARL